MKKNLPFILFFAATILTVFIFYFHTIFFAVKSFDEITPFKEIHMPVCFSFSEIFELISLLGLHHYFEASNTLYSSIISIRSNPVGDFLVLLVQFFCRKNPVNYHSYSLILHLINTAFLFLILNKIAIEFAPTIKNALRLLAISLLTFLWATHPVNIESILLLTNYNPTFSYTLCILTIYIYLNHISNSTLKSIILFITFLPAVLTAEYLFMLPFILFSYTFAISKSFKYSLKQTLPLFIVSIIFILSFLFSSSKINLQAQSSLLLTLERVFWFSPQILFHLVKLFILPVKLSIDQAFFVKLGEIIFSPYSIFCILTITIALFCSLKSLLNSKKQYPFLFIIFIPFFISLIPFSHILAPVYNLASERYLYLPSFIFIFGLSHLIFHVLNKSESQNKFVYPLILFLFIITSAYSARAFIRTLDWKDSFTLYKSAIDTVDNPLYKAFRYKLLTPQEKIFSQFQHKEVDPVYQEIAINNLKLAIEKLEREKQQYQSHIPLIVKSYGLDPATLLAKTGYLLAHSDYTINKDAQRALNIVNPYVKDLSLLDNAGLAFYASLYFFNKLPDEAEKILRYAHKKYPYSTRITFPLCQLIYMQTGKLDEVEKLSLMSYKYFPYDTFTLLYLIKLYMLKGDNEKYAFFSYAYGLRHHSIESLEIARNLYLMLNKLETAKKIEKRISFLKTKLNKRA